MISAQRRKTLWRAACAGAAVTGALLLYFFAPTEYPFYPRCLFHVATGLACPGCGSLRAAHSLLHGDVANAFLFNPLPFVLLPVAGLAWLVYRPASLTAIPPKWIWTLVGVIIAFGVLRNLPITPFTYLNP
jgi:hypothetical protein